MASSRPELVPGRPLGDDEGVGDEDPGGLVVGREHGHGLAGLDDERLVVAERLEGFDDGPIAIPVAGGPSRPAVDDEVPGLLGHVGIEVVHQHPEGALLGPAPGVEGVPAIGPDGFGRSSRIRSSMRASSTV